MNRWTKMKYPQAHFVCFLFFSYRNLKPQHSIQCLYIWKPFTYWHIQHVKHFWAWFCCIFVLYEFFIRLFSVHLYVWDEKMPEISCLNKELVLSKILVVYVKYAKAFILIKQQKYANYLPLKKIWYYWKKVKCFCCCCCCYVLPKAHHTCHASRRWIQTDTFLWNFMKSNCGINVRTHHIGQNQWNVWEIAEKSSDLARPRKLVLATSDQITLQWLDGIQFCFSYESFE